MPNPEWGVKRLCPSCAARFYDLGNDPATCPACAGSFSLDSLTLKRGRAERADPKASAAARVRPDVLEDEDDVLEAEDDIGVADDILEDDEDDEAVPLDDIADRPTEDPEN